MKTLRVSIFFFSLVFSMRLNLFSVCTPNPCSLPLGPTRCAPVDNPNTCDTQHWCIDRNNININPRQDQTGNCAYFVDVDATYQLSCTGGGVGVLPYNDVWLWLTMRTGGCSDPVNDLGDYPNPHYMCNTIVAGPWLLVEVENPSDPVCSLQNTRKFSTAGVLSGCNTPPPYSIDISVYTWMCPACEYYWEVDLTRGLGLPALDWVGRDRVPATVCMTETPTTSSPTESPSESPSETQSTPSETPSGTGTGTETPSETPSDTTAPSPSPTDIQTETIIKTPCVGQVEPIGTANPIGREAGVFGALHDLRPVGGTFLVQAPSNALGGPLGECPFVFSFNGSFSQGTPNERQFNMSLPGDTKEPLLYYQHSANDWRPLPDQEYETNGTLRVTPDVYGFFQVFAKITNPKPNVGEVYVFPNPSKNGDVPTVHIDADKSDEVSIRIYDVSGDLVAETFVTSGIKSENGKPCYEHPLNPNLFKSGVYIGAVTIKRNGQTGRKTFRFTVTK